jgi:hypothetical protein
MLLVYRYRIKSLTGLLNSQARACNFVWNFCNDTPLAGTINAVSEQYAKSRRQRNRPFLRWRGRRSLGWVPLKGRNLKREGNAFRFRGVLRYKATAHGAWYEEVNESFSSRVCSSCAAKTGPKGIAELGIRSWVCAECGVAHDRDINSAKNILFRSGHRTPAEGIPQFTRAGSCRGRASPPAPRRFLSRDRAARARSSAARTALRAGSARLPRRRPAHRARSGSLSHSRSLS